MNQNNKRYIRIGLIALLMIGCFLLGNYAVRYGIVIGKDSDNLKYAIQSIEKYPELVTLLEVRNDIEYLYTGDINSKELIENATKAMTETLGDPYTVYMNEKEYKKYMESNSGSFMGIGVYLSLEDSNIIVTGVMEDGGAEAAGMKVGDVIKTIDDKDVSGDLNKAVSLLSGEKEQVLKLLIERQNEGNIELKVKRSKIKTISVESEMLEDNVGYIRLKSFSKNCSKEFSKELDSLLDKGMKGLVLDLRDNGGGYLNEAINIASEFIDKGKIVTYTIDKYDKKIEYKAVGENTVNIPITILINGNSASASEVLTGALRDYEVAKTVGTTSFGKGIVQEVFHLSSGEGGFKVTVSKYYTPNGENIHKTGIAPNYEVELSEGTDNQLEKAIEVIKDEIK